MSNSVHLVYYTRADILWSSSGHKWCKTGRMYNLIIRKQLIRPRFRRIRRWPVKQLITKPFGINWQRLTTVTLCQSIETERCFRNFPEFLKQDSLEVQLQPTWLDFSVNGCWKVCLKCSIVACSLVVFGIKRGEACLTRFSDQKQIEVSNLPKVSFIK